MKRSRIDALTLELTVGDIARQDRLDAVVNAANAQLQTGGGVAGALHDAAGPELEAAGRPLAPIRPGEAVMTPAFHLPNEVVIHCLGPVYGRDEPAAELLASCYREALHLAEERELRSIAFPAISTGVFGYPADEAARVALGTMVEQAPTLRSVELVRFVLYNDESFQVHARTLDALTAQG